ncbi:MAG: hypothetical protein U5L72_14125 [Bacteroidales bacterium]|nr:hypothetical protein [Bacteroidales bacterium]
MRSSRAAGVVAVGRMHNHPGRLVNDDQVIVLEDNAHREYPGV